jgi:hypothetical protein
MYVNAILFTLLHCYVFQPPKWPSLGSTDTFREQGKQNTFPDVKYKVKEQRVICYLALGHVVSYRAREVNQYSLKMDR